MFSFSKENGGDRNMFLRSEDITGMDCSSSSELIRFF